MQHWRKTQMRTGWTGRSLRLVAGLGARVLLAGSAWAATAVDVVRDLPTAILSTTTSFEVQLAVTVTGTPNSAIVSEQVPAGWTITAATWKGEAFLPVLIGGTYKWLFEDVTGTGKPVGSGTLAYTVDTGGAGAGTATFGPCSAKWIDAGAEQTAASTGDTGVTIYGPVTVTAVSVEDGLTVEVTFSDAVGATAEIPANYTVSGSGMGTLAAHPNAVAKGTGNAYTLTWSAGEMKNGGDITITVTGVLDTHGLPLGTPNSGTDAAGAIGTAPTADFTYDPAAATNQDVVATLVPSEGVTVTNNGGALTKTFTENGTFEFQFADAAGNTGSATAEVTWIDRTAPTVTTVDPAADSTITTTSVNLDITFSEPMQGVDATDMVLTGTSVDGSTVVASATNVSGNVWRFTITGLKPGSGTLSVSLAPDAADIQDLAGNDLANATWSYTILIPVHHQYDADQDWVLSAAELQTLKGAWAAGTLPGGYDQDYYILWAVELYQAGAYHYDGGQTGYKIWQPGN